jgi:hypothetical protein
MIPRPPSGLRGCSSPFSPHRRQASTCVTRPPSPRSCGPMLSTVSSRNAPAAAESGSEQPTIPNLGYAIIDILNFEGDDFAVRPTTVSTMQRPKPDRDGDRPSIRGRAIPFKMVVVATDTADAVAAAGGLIFDSVRAGWTVDIYLETHSDDRALRILGAEGEIVPAAFEFEAEWPDAVILAAALHERHRGVQRLVAGSTRRQHTDVAFWGQAVPAGFDDANMEHRLSTAARAFKRLAMDAAGLAPSSALVEPFRGGQCTIGGDAQSASRSVFTRPCAPEHWTTRRHSP